MDLFLIGLVTGAAAAWVAKDGAVWHLAEAARFWRTECLAAESDLTTAHDRHPPRPHIRPPEPRHIRTRTVRNLTELRPNWPGYRTTLTRSTPA